MRCRTSKELVPSAEAEVWAANVECLIGSIFNGTYVSRFRSRVGVPMGAVCNAPANNVCSTISKCELGARSNLAHSMNLLRSSLRSLLLRQGRKPKHVVPLLRCRNAGIRPCLPHTRRESALSRTGSYKRDRRSRSGAYRTPELHLLELSGKILGSLPVRFNLPVFCRMAVRRATRTEKNGTRGSLVSQLRPLAQPPENSPQLNSYR